MAIVYVGIDLAKNVFAMHGVDGAVQRPTMRFVPPKSLEQQSQLMVHRPRQGYVEARTASINRICGLLSEFGHVLPLKADTVRRQAGLLSELHHLDERIAGYDRHIAAIAREDARAGQLMRLRGVGQTTATTIVAMIGSGHESSAAASSRPGWA